jgi:ADP-heptose:LPS heptosyltransferase
MGIGDNFMFLRSLSFYNLDNCPIYWVIKEECSEAIDFFLPSQPSHYFSIKGKRGFRDIIFSTFRMIKFLKSLKKANAIILDYKSKPVLFFLIIGRIAGIRRVSATVSDSKFGFLYTNHYPLEKYLNKHEVERYNDLLDTCFSRKQTPSIDFLANVSFKNERSNLKKYIVVVPGSARKFKQWNIENYISVINFLLSMNYQVVILGGREDILIGDTMINKIKNANLTNLINKTTLVESAYVLKSSILVITNDSAMMHLADLLDVRVIGLFGVTRPQRCGPYSQINNTIYAQGKNAGVYYYGEFLNWDDSCINTILLETVYRKINKTLDI